jgi:signal transduction histidine kinase
MRGGPTDSSNLISRDCILVNPSVEQSIPKKIIWRPSIRFYLVLMNLVVLCLLFPSVSIPYLHQEAKVRDARLRRTIQQMRHALESRNGALVRNMALSAGYAVAGYDFTFINNMVFQVVAEDPEIKYCVIMNADSRAVAHSDPKKVGSILTGPWDRKAAALMHSAFPPMAEEGTHPQVHFIDESIDPEVDIKHAPIMEALAPIYNGARLYAVLRCGFSLERLSSEIRATRQDQARRSRQFEIYLASITGIFFTIGVVIAALFTRAFVRSMDVVSTGVSRVAQGDLGHSIQPGGLVCAELLKLSEAFNAMTTQLRVSHQQLDEHSKSLELKVAARTKELKDAQANLLQQAHEAGMAEMAVGILHNIGNAVTPAKVGVFRLSSRMEKKPLLRDLPTALSEIAALIPSFTSLSDSEKERLLTIIKLVPAAIDEEYAFNAEEVERIRRKLNHIDSIISLQMRYAQLVGDVESIDLPLVVEDALTLLDDALQKNSVRIIKRFEQVPPVRIEKTKLIQIIVNLIKNGYEAMDNVPAEDRVLVLAIRHERGPADNLVLSVKDNGIGFAPDKRQQLFQFGYSTKSKGSGFGLHSCANYLIARNGSISAHSEGLNKGAEFVVRLAVHESGVTREGG